MSKLTGKSRSIQRTCISLFVSFCATLFGTMALILTIILSTICNPNYIIKSYEKSGFYNRITGEIRVQYINIGIPGGISEEFFENSIDEACLRTDILSQINAAFKGESYKVSVNEQHTFLYEQLLEYAQNEKGAALTDDLTENLSHLTDLCMEVYVDSVSSPLTVQIGNLSYRYTPYIWIGMAVVCILLFASILFLFCLHRRKDIPPRYLQFSTISIGLILLIPSAAALINGFMERINITVPSLFYFMNAYISNLIKTVLWIGIGVGVIGTALLAGICYLLHKHYTMAKEVKQG